jgi:hypothetical protein
MYVIGQMLVVQMKEKSLEPAGFQFEQICLLWANGTLSFPIQWQI